MDIRCDCVWWCMNGRGDVLLIKKLVIVELLVKVKIIV